MLSRSPLLPRTPRHPLRSLRATSNCPATTC
nr:MAG TPA: hypothetical protein [Caudoviricetes sp.]